MAVPCCVCFVGLVDREKRKEIDRGQEEESGGGRGVGRGTRETRWLGGSDRSKCRSGSHMWISAVSPDFPSLAESDIPIVDGSVKKEVMPTYHKCLHYNANTRQLDCRYIAKLIWQDVLIGAKIASMLPHSAVCKSFYINSRSNR